MIFKFNNFVRLFVPFGLTQALGIYAASRFWSGPARVELQRPVSFSTMDFVVLVLLASLFIFIIIRSQRVSGLLFRFFLTVIVFSGVQSVAGIWVGPATSILIGTLAVILMWFFNSAIVQNVVMVLTLAGIGAAFGLSLSPILVVWVLVAASFYDIIAVYKTGHMVKMAEAMIHSRAIFGFVIPEPGRSVREKIANVVPGQGFMILGSGDVVFPLLLSASLVRVSINQSVIVAVFSVFGLFLMHLIFNNQKVRRPMAALPPIALLSIIGYLIANLL